MDRRDFLKIASATGLSLVSPAAWGGRDLSFGRPNPLNAGEPWDGPFFIFVHAVGGWDPTHVCDAKHKADEFDITPMTNLLPQDIGEIVPGMRFPSRFDPAFYGAAGGETTSFMERYSSRMTVLNGIDLRTNGHGAGNNATFTGVLSDDYPTLAAYLAATHNPSLPMAFLTFGGLSRTRDIAPRVRAGSLDVLRSLSHPHRLNPNDEGSAVLSDRAIELLDEARFHGEKALLDGQRLPRLRNAMSTLFTARAGAGELERLNEYLPATTLPGMAGQAQVAIAAFRAGISVSANLMVPGFDTHGAHDANAPALTDNLLSGVDVAIQEAEAHGIADKLVVVVGSELGRTPGYNAGNGKDHWPITSMMFLGQGIEEGRVVGASTPRHGAYGIDDDLNVIEDENSGMNLLPSEIHWSFRKRFAMGEDNPLAELFPMNNERKLEIF